MNSLFTALSPAPGPVSDGVLGVMPAAPAEVPASPAALPLFLDALRGIVAAQDVALAEGAAEVDGSGAADGLAGGLAGLPTGLVEEGGDESQAEGVEELAIPAFGVSALEPAVNVVAATVLAALGMRAAPAADGQPRAGASEIAPAATAEVGAVGGEAGFSAEQRGAWRAGTAQNALANASAHAPVGGIERPSAAERGTAATAASSAAPVALPQGEAPRSDAAAAVIKLPNGEATQWRQPLLQALGERLQVELGRGSERAVIRLDPPMMGSIEIVIRHEGGALQVHLSATHGEVLRQLQALGDSLRQDLVHRQYAEVSVQVSDGSRDADGRQRQQQAQDEGRPGRALAEAEGEQDRPAFALAPDRE